MFLFTSALPDHVSASSALVSQSLQAKVSELLREAIRQCDLFTSSSTSYTPWPLKLDCKYVCYRQKEAWQTLWSIFYVYYLTVCPSVSVNTQISAIIRARHLQFDMKIAIYHTEIKYILDFGWHAYRLMS